VVLQEIYFFSSWNKIPSYVKNVKTVSGFKRSYKKQRAGNRFGGTMEGWSTTRGRHSPRGPSETTGSSTPRTRTNITHDPLLFSVAQGIF
jgi:hypothetical protein